MHGLFGSSFPAILVKQVVDFQLQIASLNSRLANLTQDKQVEMILLLHYIAKIVRIEAIARREGSINCTLLKDATWRRTRKGLREGLLLLGASPNVGIYDNMARV